MSYITFDVSETQSDKAKKWIDHHDKEKHIKAGGKYRYTGASGGAYSWKFTPTTIGLVISMECSCGDQIDLTDYNDW